MLTTADIRDRFLDFFDRHEHLILPSAPLIPTHDPTLMFTNAGMVPFKDIFTGVHPRPGPRAASVQKCIRISGKHNDLENVGKTSRHHTFFEMLGNFSFGDYFKEEACRFGWELLTEGFGLSPKRLRVTVFAGDDNAPADDEAERIWRDQVRVPPECIRRLGAKDNFWAMGDVGPCGPCSEIHYDRGPRFGEADIENGERFFELWNLVFMQYLVTTAGGPLEPLPKPCIDTGAGLERIASILQRVESNYDTDVFTPLISRAAELAERKYGADETDDVSIRVIADHARMTAFLVAEGVFPEKTAREYVLRRVMRRAIRHGHRLGIDDLFLHEVARLVVETMGDAYPELREHEALIERVCRQEEERFRATLGRGLELLRETTQWERDPDGGKVLPGEIAFDLTATYGFPKDLIEVIGREDGFAIDETSYDAASKKHKAASGAGKIGDAAVAPIYHELSNSLGGTEFDGYEKLEGTAQILAVVADGATVAEARENQEIEIILDRTPFYAESGGQVGDHGILSTASGAAVVTDTLRPGVDLTIHRVRVSRGRLRVGDRVELKVDAELRSAIRRHHTATHLLHSALREVLGRHATQKGSRVDSDGLRFDFAHFEAMSGEQIEEVERIVARAITRDSPVKTEDLPFDEAKQRGAMALFGERYADHVRVVGVGPSSLELCGGTHVSRSGEIGAFAIVSETGIAAGIRRIEAVAGLAATEHFARSRRLLAAAAGKLKVAPEELVDRIDRGITREKQLLREIESLKRELASGRGHDLLDEVRDIGGVKVLGARVGVGDPATLRETADRLRDQLEKGIVCLAGEHKGKAALIVAVSKDLTDEYRAGALVSEVAALVGGRGGGRPDFAQAGGPDVSKIDDAVEEIYAAVKRIQFK